MVRVVVAGKNSWGPYRGPINEKRAAFILALRVVAFEESCRVSLWGPKWWKTFIRREK